MTTTIEHQIRIDAPRHQVFTALATADGIRRWFTPHVEGEVGPGRELVLHFPSRGETFRWNVTELNEGSSVRLDCVDGPGEAAGTSVTYRLSDTDDGRTQVDCDQEGWSADAGARTRCNTRWGLLMFHLRSAVESGEPDPAFP